MKQIFIIILLVITYLNSNNAFAQVLTPYVFSTNGGYVTSPNMAVSFTIGETFSTTLQNSANILTQGFQQPELWIKTGTLSSTICVGSSFLVPYTANGFSNTGNIFTAQLSNASGSFASPINLGTVSGISSGTINANIPFGTPTGGGYRIRVVSSLPSVIGSNNGSNLTILNGCSVTLNLKLFLQGYYTGAGNLAPVLLNQGIGSTISIVDAVNVELHNALSPYNLLASSVVLLNTNGSVICTFPVPPGSYFVAIKHRNTLETWTSSPIFLSAIPSSYDFTIAASKALGSNQYEVEPSLWAFYSGDINQDGSIDAFDYILQDPDIVSGVSGYLNSDLNGDGTVDAFDYIILDPNIILGLGSILPQ